jgi:hypothetical protein
VSLETFTQGDCVVIEPVLTKDIIDAVIRYTVKIEANRLVVSLAYATIS